MFNRIKRMLHKMSVLSIGNANRIMSTKNLVVKLFRQKIVKIYNQYPRNVCSFSIIYFDILKHIKFCLNIKLVRKHRFTFKFGLISNTHNLEGGRLGESYLQSQSGPELKCHLGRVKSLERKSL